MMKKALILAFLTIGLAAFAVSCADPSDPHGGFVDSPANNSDSETKAVTTAEPETTSAEPETTSSEPETTSAEPETTSAEPETTSAEPETTSAEQPSTPSIPDDGRSFHFPLLGNNDTTSYVSLPDLEGDGGNYVEFFIVPTDTEDPVLTSAYQLRFPQEGETNILVLAATSDDGNPHILFLKESTYLQEVNGEETRFVAMQGGHFMFRTYPYGQLNDYYYFLDGGGSASLQYTEAVKKSVLLANRNSNNHALKSVEKLLDKYRNNDSFTYKFTILYSYVNGVETFNKPVDSIPEFTFDLFKQYGFYD